jgi:epoxyqueuosine reductase
VLREIAEGDFVALSKASTVNSRPDPLTHLHLSVGDPVAQAIEIKAAAQALGFDKVGIADLSQGPDLSTLQTWLDQGYGADMDWMRDRRRQDPEAVLAGARSIICVALNYYTPHPHSPDPGVGKLSRYAWGRDYHKVLGSRLKALSRWIEGELPTERTRWYVDTGPVAEKLWAMQAGLGWIGKHSLLLTRELGSWVFLGVVLTTLDLAADAPHTAHCGTCTRCIEACPTGAITDPGGVDARRCIAYHTLESHDLTLPDLIQTNLHNWVAGCDICQEVCPWNQRFATPSRIPDFQPYPGLLAPLLRDLAQMDEATFSQQFPASALRRLKAHRLRRNAQAALSGQESNLSSIDSNPDHQDP